MQILLFTICISYLEEKN